jgi:membrane protein DedA with SNARE-associated domain
MISHFLEFLSQWIILVEQTLGIWGIGLLMSLESACVPLPSEVIMPFAGYLVSKGTFSLWQTGLAGALGCVFGSWVAYFAGMYGGRPFAHRYGRFFLINSDDLDLADRLFAKYGELITFVSRLLPIIRTFIALPAGVARMNFWKFTFYTFLGSLPWCLGLAWVGMKLGENWTTLHSRFHQIDIVIAGLLLVAGIFWIKHHLSFLKSSKRIQKLS